MGQMDARGQGSLHTADSDSTNAALAAAVDMRTRHVNLTVEVPKDGYEQTVLHANPGMDLKTAHKLASMTKRGMKPSDLKSHNKDILSIGDHLILPDAPYPTSTSAASRDARPGSPEDKADQASKLQFPDDKDSHYRALARQELLAERGGTKLTPEETADLASKRQFPDAADSRYRELARKELLGETGGTKLTPDESADLQGRRRQARHDGFTPSTAGMEEVFPSHRTESILNGTDWTAK
jgi:hypothetical protein